MTDMVAMNDESFYIDPALEEFLNGTVHWDGRNYLCTGNTYVSRAGAAARASARIGEEYFSQWEMVVFDQGGNATAMQWSVRQIKGREDEPSAPFVEYRKSGAR